MIPVYNGSQDPQEVLDEWEAAFGSFSKHGEGSHDDKSHGNWATGNVNVAERGRQKSLFPEKVPEKVHLTEEEHARMLSDLNTSVWTIGRGKHGTAEFTLKNIDEDMVDRFANGEQTAEDVEAVFGGSFTLKGETYVVETSGDELFPTVYISRVDGDDTILVGQATRGLDGWPTVYNEVFEIGHEFRHEGIGLTVLSMWENQLGLAGAEEMTLSAAGDGRYVWPFYGYESYVDYESARDIFEEATDNDDPGQYIRDFLSTRVPRQFNTNDVLEALDYIAGGDASSYDVVTWGSKDGSITELGKMMIDEFGSDDQTKSIWPPLRIKKRSSAIDLDVLYEWIANDPAAVERLDPEFTKALWEARKRKLSKHTPGGHEHDQSGHGNWAGGGKGSAEAGANRWGKEPFPAGHFSNMTQSQWKRQGPTTLDTSGRVTWASVEGMSSLEELINTPLVDWDHPIIPTRHTTVPPSQGRLNWYKNGLGLENYEELNEAVNRYTSLGFAGINDHLRVQASGTAPVERPNNRFIGSDNPEQMISVLDSGMQTVEQPITLLRGVSHYSKTPYAEGLEWRNPAYTSTTVNPRIAMAFTDRTLLRITVNPGVKALAVGSTAASYHEGVGEGEILLGRGTKFNVVKHHRAYRHVGKVKEGGGEGFIFVDVYDMEATA